MAIPLKYNLRNLVARKMSTGMTAFVIGLVTAVFLCVLALIQGVTRTLSVSASTRNVIAMRIGSQAEMQSVITRDQAEQIQALPGPERDAAGQALRLAGAADAHQHRRGPTGRRSRTSRSEASRPSAWRSGPE